MIKFIRVEAYDLKIPSMMIIMANKAIFVSDLFRRMVPFVYVDPGFDLFMAVETFIIGHFITKSMTLSTVGSSFQVFVNFSKITGRKLRYSYIPHEHADNYSNRYFYFHYHFLHI